MLSVIKTAWPNAPYTFDATQMGRNSGSCSISTSASLDWLDSVSLHIFGKHSSPAMWWCQSFFHMFWLSPSFGGPERELLGSCHPSPVLFLVRARLTCVQLSYIPHAAHSKTYSNLQMQNSSKSTLTYVLLAKWDMFLRESLQRTSESLLQVYTKQYSVHRDSEQEINLQEQAYVPTF
jgi:hypothetical protein